MIVLSRIPALNAEAAEEVCRSQHWASSAGSPGRPAPARPNAIRRSMPVYAHHRGSSGAVAVVGQCQVLKAARPFDSGRSARLSPPSRRVDMSPFSETSGQPEAYQTIMAEPEIGDAADTRSSEVMDAGLAREHGTSAAILARVRSPAVMPHGVEQWHSFCARTKAVEYRRPTTAGSWSFILRPNASPPSRSPDQTLFESSVAVTQPTSLNDIVPAANQR